MDMVKNQWLNGVCKNSFISKELGIACFEIATERFIIRSTGIKYLLWKYVIGQLHQTNAANSRPNSL